MLPLKIPEGPIDTLTQRHQECVRIYKMALFIIGGKMETIQCPSIGK